MKLYEISTKKCYRDQEMTKCYLNVFVVANDKDEALAKGKEAFRVKFEEEYRNPLDWKYTEEELQAIEHDNRGFIAMLTGAKGELLYEEILNGVTGVMF
jgi:hypothetical protein